MINTGSVTTFSFENTVVNELPIDRIQQNYVREVKDALISLVLPTPIQSPRLVHYSKDCLELLDIPNDRSTEERLLRFMSGNEIIPGSIPYAQSYCGYQFGSFAGQLGDGRAITLGDMINFKHERWEIQLKGAGRTPYSRSGDGRAVLRSSIREFICSEAMHYLGIPTTRALSIITSDTDVMRDIEYNGKLIREKATVVARVAPSFIRFGSFQIADPVNEKTGVSGPNPNNYDLIKTLLSHVISNFYPDSDSYPTLEKKVVSFADELCWKTAYTVACWQSLGFTHGVLNTDNMSVLGLTIDYGPFGFLDDYDPNFVPNKTDKDGRYRFSNQSGICKWNLQRLFESISRAIPQIKDTLEEISEDFCRRYKILYTMKMRLKLGLQTDKDNDIDLIEYLLGVMRMAKADYTNTFRLLSNFDPTIENDELTLALIVGQCRTEGDEARIARIAWIEWLQTYRTRLMNDGEYAFDHNKKKRIMNSNNPRFVPRNYLLQDAIEKAEQGDYSEVRNLAEVVTDPYDRLGKYNNTKYDQRPAEGQASVPLSCSS